MKHAGPEGEAAAMRGRATEATTALPNPGTPSASLPEGLSRPGPWIAVELRPPRLGMDSTRSMGRWIDMHHAVRRLARAGTFVLLTDDAAGDPEEESLAHLAANLGESADFGAVIPFLTCKHPLSYCRLFARRASGLGVAAVAVVGGDHSAGPERCLPHSKDLRRILRADQPGLPLGGWANPHRDPVAQARFVADHGYAADFVLTQIVSHHSLAVVERFHAELSRLGVELPVVHGVFHYQSANSRTLRYLDRYFPVPARRLAREFEAGDDSEAICRRTIRALAEVGADKVYLSNLPIRDAAGALARIAGAGRTG